MISFIYLMGVVLNITIFKGEQYGFMAAKQRIQTYDSSRGAITDRNMIPFTGKEQRYRQSTLAKHIIGYTDAFGTGISGIEKTFENELSDASDISGRYLKDAKGDSISVFKAENSQIKKYVKLTLDYHIQQTVENVLDQHNVTGGAVVISTDSFDVMASASRPDFDCNCISEYIKNGSTALINRAITSYPAEEIASHLNFLVENGGITPLKAAEAMTIAGNKGISKEVNLTDSIVAENGYIIKSMRKNNSQRIISKEDASKIPHTIIGLTWAAGYFPENDPRYAVAIYAERSSDLRLVYEQIMQEILMQ